jgi:hypothetical protein
MYLQQLKFTTLAVGKVDGKLAEGLVSPLYKLFIINKLQIHKKRLGKPNSCDRLGFPTVTERIFPHAWRHGNSSHK